MSRGVKYPTHIAPERLAREKERFDLFIYLTNMFFQESAGSGLGSKRPGTNIKGLIREALRLVNEQIPIKEE